MWRGMEGSRDRGRKKRRKMVNTDILRKRKRGTEKEGHEGKESNRQRKRGKREYKWKERERKGR